MGFLLYIYCKEKGIEYLVLCFGFVFWDGVLYFFFLDRIEISVCMFMFVFNIRIWIM